MHSMAGPINHEDSVHTLFPVIVICPRTE
jgi:hypothetical protein